MIRRPASLLAALSLALLAAGPQGARAAEATPAADTGTYRTSLGERKLLLPSVTVEGTPFVSLKAMAAALGGVLRAGARPGDLALELFGRRLVFSADEPTLVSYEAGMTSLSRPARPIGGDLYVPADFIARVVEPLATEPPGGGTRVGPGDAAGANRLEVRIIGGTGSLQLVLESPRAIPYELDDTGEELVLRLRDTAIGPPYASRAIGSPLLSTLSFELAGADGLIARLRKGADYYKAAVFDLKNPYRIVVDLQARAATRVEVGDGAGASGAGITITVPALPGAPPARRTLRTVVLDPGHGGEQLGAEGAGGLVEKEVTLDIVRRLQRLLRQEGLEAVATRETDADLPLIERTAIANRERADLFVSVHVNSSPRRDARGAETYYLAYQATDQDSHDLAAAENASAGEAWGSPGGAGPEMILWDLAQAQHLRESSSLAEILQKELNEALGVRDRGVKQAPFTVLMGATMPAVLVEVGFASNPAEEAELMKSEYRDRIAGALLRGILRFKETFDRRQGAALR